MTVFEILIGLEVAAIAGMIGIAFAPASLWALFNREPPAWTNAARSRAVVRKPRKTEDPLALESIVQDVGKDLFGFGEMG